MASLSAGSDALYYLNCVFCQDFGLNSEAEGFCVECDVYICGNCITHHTRNRATRQHLIKDKDTVPKVTSVSLDPTGSNLMTILYERKSSQTRSITAATFVKDINVQQLDDRTLCGVTGSAVMTDNRLIITDFQNSKVKQIDTNLNKVINELKVCGSPWDVAIISTDRVAVTLCSYKILILNVTNVITVTGEINVDHHDCRGICFSKNTLIVSYINPPKVELISLDGRVTRRIENDCYRNPLFKKPYYVCVSNDGETIIVSDKMARKVLSLTVEGVVKASYTDIGCPEKVCVDLCDNIIVCNNYEKNIHMLTIECIKVWVIPTETKKSESNFKSVSRCQRTDKLYVGMGLNNNVKVYQLS